MSDAQHKRLRPGNRAVTGERIKLHLRLLRLNGETWRVLTLRPGTDAAFSTNYFHHTWHFLTDKAGAELLGRILWGMSYQREPNTLFLLHGEHLKPTPFEAEPSLPFVIAPAHLTAPDPQAFAKLRQMLPRLPNPDTTVCLQTWGLTALLEDEDDPNWQEYGMPHRRETEAVLVKERVTLCGRMIAYCAPPCVMRMQGCHVHETDYWYTIPVQNGVGYHELAQYADPEQHLGQGEVQIFRRYRDMLSEASEARRELARDNGGKMPDVPREQLHAAVWKKTEQIAMRRLKAKHRTRRNDSSTTS